jgi:GTP:adenosylcobinamide-phosphate guanylyltransferase
MDVVVLAGGRCPDELREATGVELRAALPIAGAPMARHVIECLPTGGRAIVVGFEMPGVHCVAGGESFVGSLSNGLAEVESETFLLSAADLPFLMPDSLSEFLGLADPAAAINYPIVPVALCEAAFPGMKRTAIRVREGKFTGGNVALCNTALMRGIFPIVEAAYANRKTPFKLAMQVGFGTLFRVALGQLMPFTLPIAALENRIGRFLGARVRAIVTSRPEVGADVDTLEQYRQAVEILESR